MSILVISDFPLPPSINEGYRNVPGVGRVSAEPLKKFKKQVESWSMVHGKNFKEAFIALLNSEWRGSGTFSVSYYFVFKHDRVYCKSKKLLGKPKKIDADSRIKFAQDALGRVLGVDDSIFFRGEFEKLVGERECCVISIQPYTPITSVELFQQLNMQSPSTNSQQ